MILDEITNKILFDYELVNRTFKLKARIGMGGWDKIGKDKLS